MDTTTFVFTCAFFVVALFIRSFWATEKTYKQMMEMLESTDSLHAFDRLDALRDFSKVSFSQHKAEVFWGRDPYKLYGGDARKLIPRDKA